MEKKQTALSQAIKQLQEEVNNSQMRYKNSIIIKCIKTLEAQLQNEEEMIKEIRIAFAEYVKTEGCSCCRDNEGHEKAENKLAELLNCEPYEDGSGNDWYKYIAK